MRVTPLLLALAASTCASGQQPAAAPLATPAERVCIPQGNIWRAAATEDDRRRLRRWRDSWTEALASARSGGHADDVTREGTLLDPDAALPDPAPPPGDYDCRTVKVGSQNDLLPFVAYPAFRCRIGNDNGRLTFTRLNGSQRPVGRLYPDLERRLVFLGTMQLGDERRAYQYGVDADRDMIGLLERIGPNRWRLAFPAPRFESLLDVIELTPRTRR